MKKRIITQINGKVIGEDEFPIEKETEKITLSQLLDENFRLMSMPIDNGDTVTFRVETFA